MNLSFDWPHFPPLYVYRWKSGHRWSGRPRSPNLKTSSTPTMKTRKKRRDQRAVAVQTTAAAAAVVKVCFHLSPVLLSVSPAVCLCWLCCCGKVNPQVSNVLQVDARRVNELGCHLGPFVHRRNNLWTFWSQTVKTPKCFARVLEAATVGKAGWQ